MEVFFPPRSVRSPRDDEWTEHSGAGGQAGEMRSSRDVIFWAMTLHLRLL